MLFTMTAKVQNVLIYFHSYEKRTLEEHSLVCAHPQQTPANV